MEAVASKGVEKFKGLEQAVLWSKRQIEPSSQSTRKSDCLELLSERTVARTINQMTVRPFYQDL